MYVQRLELRDFRNWERLDIALPSGIVVFHGPNGAGKSSLLEAVCLVASGESPRAHEAQEMIRLGKEVTFLRGEFHGVQRQLRLEAGLARTGQRQIKINGAGRRRADLIGLAPVIYFSADDIAVIKGEPAARRRLVDMELSAISQPYYSQLTRYRRSMEQRNRLLKELRAGRGSAEALAPWDRAVARYGAEVTIRRHEFIASLSPEAAAAHTLLTSGRDDFLVRYQPAIAEIDAQSLASSKEEHSHVTQNISNHLESVLRAERQADIMRGATRSGPHRDDLEVLLRGAPVRSFCSQGEQRTCAVALRLGLAVVVGSVTGESPVLLLDDVLSELDVRNRGGVFQACVQAQQVIITCCDSADILAQGQQAAAYFEVGGGKLL